MLCHRGIHREGSFAEFEQHARSGEVRVDRLIDGNVDEVVNKRPRTY